MKSISILLGLAIIFTAGCEKKDDKANGKPAIETNTQTVVINEDTVNEIVSETKEEATQMGRSLYISFETTKPGGRYGDRNVHAVWVEDEAGNFVKTIGLWGQKHAKQLAKWKRSTDDMRSDIDARTSATVRAYKKYDIEWDLKNKLGEEIADGKYVIKFELTNGNEPENKFNRAAIEFIKGSESYTTEMTDEGGYKGIVLDYKAG